MNSKQQVNNSSRRPSFRLPFLTKPVAAVMLSVAVALGIVAAPASAEGYWERSFSGVLPGFTTREWTGNHNEKNSTKSKLTGCTVAHGLQANSKTSMGWELRWRRTGQPGKGYGTKTYSKCNRGSHTQTATYSWGEISDKGKFFLQVKHVQEGKARQAPRAAE